MDESLLIVGGGTFGLSTAFWATQRGYRNIKVIDRWPIPSVASAGYDINKIVRTEYANALYSKLAQESIEAWQEMEPFRSAKVFHKTGWLCLLDGKVTAEEEAKFKRGIENTKRYGDASGLEELKDAQAIKSKAPCLQGDMPGWRGYWNSNAGWVEARQALQVLKDECVRRGVEFSCGTQGAMQDLVLEHEKVCGVLAEDGTVHRADRIVLSTGAWSESLIDFQGQLKSGAYILAHLRPSPEMVQKYAQLPVICHIFGGYFFPPNHEGIIKIAHNGSTTTFNQNGWRGRSGLTSVPRDPGLHPTDVQPKEHQAKAKAMLYECAPDLAQEEITWSGLCHDTESIDHNFFICPQ